MVSDVKGPIEKLRHELLRVKDPWLQEIALHTLSTFKTEAMRITAKSSARYLVSEHPQFLRKSIAGAQKSVDAVFFIENAAHLDLWKTPRMTSYLLHNAEVALKATEAVKFTRIFVVRENAIGTKSARALFWVMNEQVKKQIEARLISRRYISDQNVLAEDTVCIDKRRLHRHEPKLSDASYTYATVTTNSDDLKRHLSWWERLKADSFAWKTQRHLAVKSLNLTYSSRQRLH